MERAPLAMQTLALDLPAARRADFLAGRHRAAEALAAMGSATVEVLRAADGAPQWPEGFVGSIAHDAQRAAALVAHRQHWCALGVDLEALAPLPEEAASLVLTATERDRLEALDTATPLRFGRLPFAAKECVHKALNPLTGAWLEFDEVVIDFGDARLPQGQWRVRPLSQAAERALAGLHGSGRWWRDAAGWLVVLGLRPQNH